ncbi:Uncharacterised protein [Enterobacter cloacae]|uniref:Uncharacterized protein n=1 Tax=Enterobacter cloacae TaxID=550 RepID=A0A377M288_ENTCL|nr:Uncharacterised protein [Enterobacter cloacae]
MTLMMIILAVCGGATLSVQAAINGQLGSRVGVFKKRVPDVLRWRAGHRLADFFL